MRAASMKGEPDEEHVVEVNRPNITARWMSTLVSVRETLYAAEKPMTVLQICQKTNGRESTVRRALEDLESRERVVRLDRKPIEWVHTHWYEKPKPEIKAPPEYPPYTAADFLRFLGRLPGPRWKPPPIKPPPPEKVELKHEIRDWIRSNRHMPECRCKACPGHTSIPTLEDRLADVCRGCGNHVLFDPAERQRFAESQSAAITCPACGIEIRSRGTTAPPLPERLHPDWP
jgi:hypothetical protein